MGGSRKPQSVVFPVTLVCVLFPSQRRRKTFSAMLSARWLVKVGMCLEPRPTAVGLVLGAHSCPRCRLWQQHEPRSRYLRVAGVGWWNQCPSGYHFR